MTVGVRPTPVAVRAAEDRRAGDRRALKLTVGAYLAILALKLAA